MPIHQADQYQKRDSPVHILDPRSKIIVALSFIVAVALLPAGEYFFYLTLYGLLLLAVFLAKVELFPILRRSLVALPFALAAATLLFTVPGETLVTLPIVGGPAVTVEGFVRFSSIVIKSWISVQAALLLAAVTQFPEILWGLRALHVPSVLVSIVGFAYRYLFVISDESLRLRQARAARSAVTGSGQSGRQLLWRGKVTGRMVGSLMIRSLERSERVYNAMAARGYQGQPRVLHSPKMSRLDYVAILCISMILTSVVILSNN